MAFPVSAGAVRLPDTSMPFSVRTSTAGSVTPGRGEGDTFRRSSGQVLGGDRFGGHHYQRLQNLARDGVVTTAPAFKPRPALTLPTGMLLSEGSEGRKVRRLQTALNRTSGARLERDGDFGPKTDRAVRRFQEKHGLDVDGIVGPKTLNVLNAEHARAADARAARRAAVPMPPARPNFGTAAEVPVKAGADGPQVPARPAAAKSAPPVLADRVQAPTVHARPQAANAAPAANAAAAAQPTTAKPPVADKPVGSQAASLPRAGAPEVSAKPAVSNAVPAALDAAAPKVAGPQPSAKPVVPAPKAPVQAPAAKAPVAAPPEGTKIVAGFRPDPAKLPSVKSPEAVKPAPEPPKPAPPEFGLAPQTLATLEKNGKLGTLRKLPKDISGRYSQLSPNLKMQFYNQLSGSTFGVSHRDAFVRGTAMGMDTFSLMGDKLNGAVREGKLTQKEAAMLQADLGKLRGLSPTERDAVADVIMLQRGR